MKQIKRVPRPLAPLNLHVGAQALWEKRLVRIEALSSASQIYVRCIGTGDTACVSLQDLAAPRPLAVRGPIRAATEPEADANALEWCKQLKQLESRECEPQDVAQKMGVSLKTVMRRLSNYRVNPLPGAQVKGIPGPARGSKRLTPAQEAIVAHVIEQDYLRPERPTIRAVVRRIEQECRAAKVKPPQMRSVRARIRARDPLQVAKARLGPHEGEARQGPSVRGIETSRALELVQIDHALIDLILVAPGEGRQVIGRPWITLAIDVHTRCILGYYLSFEYPNQTAVGLCLEHACLPKGPWLKRLEVDLDYPMCGRMDCVAWDNGKTFQALGVQAQCERYGISRRTRPPYKPHFGAYIERYIGTLMGKVHMLPGTTFSSSKQRGDYHSERRAVMTLREFERWVVYAIAGEYHHSPHRGLNGLTPMQAWTKAWTNPRGEFQLPPLISDPREFMLGFLPAKMRKVTREGLALHGLRYWDPALAPLINRQQPYRVHYHQGDLSKVYLYVDGHHVDVPLLDRTQPPFSIYELQEARRVMRAEGSRTQDETALFSAIGKQRQIEDAAAATSKKARRKQALRPKAATPAKTAVDFSRPVMPISTDWEDEL